MGFLHHQPSDSDGEQRPKSSAALSSTPTHSSKGILGVSKSPSASSISRTPSAMRPTISSANKAAPKATGSGSTPTKSLQIRRISSAVSTGDIQQALNDSSSSEETAELRSNVKARVLSFEKSVAKTTPNNSSRASAIFSSSPKAANPARRSLFNSPVTPPASTPAVRVRPSSPADTHKVLSRASCELAIESLKASVDQLLTLQRRLAGGSGAAETESNLSDRERTELLQYLSSCVTPVIQNLKSLQFAAGSGGSLSEGEKPVTGVTTPTAATPTGESNPMVVQMLQRTRT